MTSAQLLLPIRVPELGPSLGRVVVGTGRTPGGIDLAAVRLRLAARVIDLAGEARRRAPLRDREEALRAIDRKAWLGAWEETVDGVIDLMIDQANTRIRWEAEHVRMPKRRLQQLLVTPQERRTLHARVGSSAAGLVKSLDQVESCIPAAAAGKSGDGMRAWQRALTLAARRLEASWLSLEDAVAEESSRWDAVVDRVSRWRKPLWPVVLVGVLVTGVGTWVGLVFGGYLEAPDWFASLWAAITDR